MNTFGLPPDDAIRWFREKGYALNFDWRDMWAEEHARAFTVAKAAQLDLLADIRDAVDKALASGGTLRQFSKDLAPLLVTKGWWGQRSMVDPKTGIEREVQLGSPRRLKTIYETNLRQAMAAGRWERIERTANARPYLRYVAIDDGRTRKEHLAWRDTVLPWDHTWWQTHYPPNGWGCRCKVQQLSERDLDRYGLKVSSAAPKVTYDTFHDKRNDRVMRVPHGIDPSFDYNAGLVQGGAVRPINPKEIPLRDVQTYQDYGLPAAKTMQAQATAQASALWGRETTAEERAETERKFDQLFGLSSPSSEGHVTDPFGVKVAFNRRFLDHLRGEHKPPGETPDPSRIQYTPNIPLTITDPDEVWLVPFRRNDGSVTMRYRYLKWFASAKSQMLMVAERTPDGGITWTAVPSTQSNSQRKGYLLHPR